MRKIKRKGLKYKGDKEKIRALNDEIAQMKKDHYDVFHSSFAKEERIIQKEQKEKKLFDIKLPLFFAGLFLFAFGLFGYFSRIEFEKTLYLGDRVIPQRAAVLPFLVGVILLYFMKEKGAAMIVALIGLVIAAAVFLISGSIVLPELTTGERFLVFGSAFSGGVVCAVTIALKSFKRR